MCGKRDRGEGIKVGGADLRKVNRPDRPYILPLLMNSVAVVSVSQPKMLQLLHLQQAEKGRIADKIYICMKGYIAIHWPIMMMMRGGKGKGQGQGFCWLTYFKIKLSRVQLNKQKSGDK